MAVTIKKGYPIVLPPWKRVRTADPFSQTYTYVAFDWSKHLLLSDVTLGVTPGDRGQVPLFEGSNRPHFPVVYPRCFLETVDLLSSIQTLLASNNIFPFTPSGEAGYLFTNGLEINGQDVVNDNLGAPHNMPFTVNNRWQGGDALFLNVVVLGPADNPYSLNWYTNFSPTFPTPPYVVEATAMRAHDQAVVNSVASAFERVSFLYFYERADTPAGTDFLQEAANAVSDILQSAVAGIANAEYHRTQTRADTIAIAVAKAHSFFGV